MGNGTVVSIIVMLYRDISGLNHVLQSLSEQSYQNIELIVSDDASGEFTKKDISDITEKYENRFTKVIVNKNNKRLGTVAHLNKAINLSSGEIILSIGEDDYFAGDMIIEKAVRYFTDNTDCLMLTGLRLDEYDQKVRPCKYVRRLLKRKNQQSLRKILLRVLMIGISGCGTFYSKRLFEKYGMHDERFYLVEDAPFFVKMANDDVRIDVLDEICCIHTAGGVSQLEPDTKINPDVQRDYDNIILFMLYPIRHHFDIITRQCVEKRYAQLTKDDVNNKWYKHILATIWLGWFWMQWEIRKCS